MSPRREDERAGLRGAVYARRDALVGAPVTRAIVWTNIVVFALQVLASHGTASLGGMPSGVLHLFGANDAIMTARGGAWQTLVTACFLHGSLLHCAMNMYALRQIGPLVEVPVGSARFAVMYVATGIAGSAASTLWSLGRGEALVSVGASGAICGAMGAAIIVGLRLEGWRSAIAWNVGFWLAVTLLFGALAPHIDNAAHTGGFVAGVAIAMAWRRGVVETPLKRAILVGGSALVCLVAFGAQIVRDTNDPFASMGLDDRIERLDSALEARDCTEARRVLRAVEELEASDADRSGPRAHVDVVCGSRR